MKKRLIALVLFCFSLVSCELSLIPGQRSEDKWDRVLILYSAGFNDLYYQISNDQKELVDAEKNPFIPRRSEKKALVVISHLPDGGDYSKQTSPCIVQVRREEMTSDIITDTLFRAPAGTCLTDKGTMRELLEIIRDGFKSDHYGLIFESHATGWLPEGYYNSGLVRSLKFFASGKDGAKEPQGYVSINDVSSVPVRSFGDHYYYEGTVRRSRQMEITDMAEAVPMHLDYIVFDACLMGGIEVAYQFKDIADYIAFSPAEVLGAGMNYSKVAGRLLKPAKPDI